jgi:predicted CopG family antitoxin
MSYGARLHAVQEKNLLCLCTNTKGVATKTIGISEDAYERLLALKGEGESFSDVIRRLTGADLLARLAGAMDADTARHYESVIAASRARQDRDRRGRVQRMVDE